MSNRQDEPTAIRRTVSTALDRLGSTGPGAAVVTALERTVPTAIGDPSTRRLRRGAVGVAVFAIVWTAVATLYPPYILPSPLAVGAAFFAELTTAAVYRVPLLGVEVTLTTMLVKTLQSLHHYLPGLVIGVVLGAPLGITLGWSRRLEEYVRPVVGLLRPIPPLAWMGFVIVWVGIGHAGATVIVTVGSFWITFFNAYDGVEKLSDAYLDVGRSLGFDDDLTLVRKVVLPGVAPDVATGVRTSIGRCWMIVVAAELFGAPGIGYRIIHAAQSLSMDVSMAYMLVMSLLYLGSELAFEVFMEGLRP
jgi:NitT/TauT family transport system permease protein